MAFSATDVDVDISDILIISALNTPGRAVFEWRDDVAKTAIFIATVNAPVNDVLNARHRAGWVGEYKRSFGFDRQGSNGHRVRAAIYNEAAHADIVENGRRGSFRFERFSWTRHKPPGSVAVHEGTSGRPGTHLLENSVRAAVNLHT